MLHGRNETLDKACRFVKSDADKAYLYTSMDSVAQSVINLFELVRIFKDFPFDPTLYEDCKLAVDSIRLRFDLLSGYIH